MQERQVARKADIKTLHMGDYIVQEGFNPNYIEVNGEKYSRVVVLAVVIDKFVSEDGNYAALTLDDGTDTIRLKAFQDLRILDKAEKGDVVDVVGKIREYNEERYIQPETIAKIENPNYEVLRKLELSKLSIAKKASSGSVSLPSEAQTPEYSKSPPVSEPKEVLGLEENEEPPEAQLPEEADEIQEPAKKEALPNPEQDIMISRASDLEKSPATEFVASETQKQGNSTEKEPSPEKKAQATQKKLV
jgi:RPA family protein